MPIDCDFLVIGAGVSGSAAAAELALQGKTILLDMEDHPGHHSSGRSAALYTPNYGPGLVRQICQAAYDFFQAPPQGFADHPLLSPRGALSLGVEDPEDILGGLLKDAPAEYPVEEISMARAKAICPAIRQDAFRRAVYERLVLDMDAAAILQGYLRMLKARGGSVATAAGVTALERSGGQWTAVTASETYRAPTVVNAAGAWADRVGALAGAIKIGLQPCLRTVMVIPAPAEFCGPDIPVADVVDSWAYFKPEAGRILASPGDETPVDPFDAYPDDMVIAELADYIERHTLLKVERVLRSWAGLRSFVPDHCPVVGFDPKADGFFWLAAQGGYGIMMSPMLGQAAAALIGKDALPETLQRRGLTPAQISPARLASGVQS
jgi:D-arginine dehydrogenase